MGYNSAIEVTNAIIQAYYNDRNVEATLSCVTDDIKWVGTESYESAKGKQEFRELLESDIEVFPESFNAYAKNIEIQKISEQFEILSVTAVQLVNSEVGYGVLVNGTVCCVNSEDGWLIVNVHTSVQSQEVERIIEEQQRLQNLINSVPAGIGIYEVENGVVSQKYMNNAFYDLLGENREERIQYIGENTLDAAHPDDISRINEAIKKLFSGDGITTVNYRLKQKNGKWKWVRLVASVVERRENYIRIYGAFSDYSAIAKAQKEMERSRETLKIALESAKVLTWRYDYKTRKITDSLTLGEMFNLPKVVEEAENTIIEMGFISTDSMDAFRRIFTRIENEDVVCEETKANILGDEGNLWYRQIYTKMYDVEGNYIDCVAIAVDITEQKRNEQKYDEKIKLNQLVAQEAMARIYINLTNNTITMIEQSTVDFKEHLEYEKADDILSSVMKEINDPEELKKFEQVADCKTIIRGYQNGVNHIEINCHLKENASWAKIIYDILENPYTGDIEMISSIHDVTEQKRSELVIQKLLDVDYKSILLIDTETGISYPFKRDGKDFNSYEINQSISEKGSQMEGLEEFFRAHAAADKVDEIIYENSPDTIAKELELNPFYECMYSLFENGKLVQYKVTYSYLEYDKRILLSAVQDVTKLYEKERAQKNELAEALTKADAANRAKTAFLSRISHDMRTPLNGILGITELIKDMVYDVKIKHDLAELEMSGNYLLNLINDTLDVSRIESGKLELNPSVCDGRTIFDNVITLAKHNIEEKHINLHIETGEIPFTKIYIDVARTQQIFMNIIGNATKFTPNGGDIYLSMKNLSVENGVITDIIKIRDNGIGMSEEFLPHIFDAFEQEDATRTSTIQGTGLGMSITKQLIDLMNGEITIESEQGKGTCVTLILKFNIATPDQISKHDAYIRYPDEDTILMGKRILLCEDHPLNAKIAVRLLEAKNIIVEHAVNGKEGVEMFERSEINYYDMILMDIRMPVMDGIDATIAIRKLQRNDSQTVPIVAMTANAFAEDVKQTMEAGMDEHVSKPVQKEILYGKMSYLLKNGRKNSH